MNKDLRKFIGLGVAVAFAYGAALNFSSKLNQVEKTGLTLGGCVVLVIAAVMLLNRIENVAEQSKRLL